VIYLPCFPEATNGKLVRAMCGVALHEAGHHLWSRNQRTPHDAKLLAKNARVITSQGPAVKRFEYSLNRWEDVRIERLVVKEWAGGGRLLATGMHDLLERVGRWHCGYVSKAAEAMPSLGSYAHPLEREEAWRATLDTAVWFAKAGYTPKGSALQGALAAWQQEGLKDKTPLLGGKTYEPELIKLAEEMALKMLEFAEEFEGETFAQTENQLWAISKGNLWLWKQILKVVPRAPQEQEEQEEQEEQAGEDESQEGSESPSEDEQGESEGEDSESSGGAESGTEGSEESGEPGESDEGGEESSQKQGEGFGRGAGAKTRSTPPVAVADMDVQNSRDIGTMLERMVRQDYEEQYLNSHADGIRNRFIQENRGLAIWIDGERVPEPEVAVAYHTRNPIPSAQELVSCGPAVRRILAARDQSRWESGYDHGRIRSRRDLQRALAGVRECKSRYVEDPAPKAGLSILVDQSGSMESSRLIGRALKTAAVLANLASKSGAPHEVVGFTTLRFTTKGALKEQHGITLDSGSTVECPELYIWKRWGRSSHGFLQNEQLISVSRKMAKWCSGTPDGSAILNVGERLLARQDCDRKILVVITDGIGTGKVVLRQVIDSLRERGVQLIGIHFDHDPGTYGEDSVVVWSTEPNPLKKALDHAAAKIKEQGG
jgi:hypothetical protein